MSKESNVKVVVVGDGSVGKTTMCVTYSTGKFPEDYVPTIFDANTETAIYKSTYVSLSIYDPSGGEDFDRLRTLSYTDTDRKIFVMAFSVVDRKSAINVLVRWARETAKYYASDTPILLVGTKTDLREDPEIIERLKEDNETPIYPFLGKKIAMMINACGYMECSSKKMQGLNEIFKDFVVPFVMDSRERLKERSKPRISNLFGLFSEFNKTKERKMSKNIRRKYRMEIEKEDSAELERLRNIIKKDINEGRKMRPLFDGLSRDVKLHILQHYVFIDFREEPPHWRKLEYCDTSKVYERRNEFYFYLDELKMNKENLLFKSFGYFPDVQKKRSIIQIFYNFFIDYHEKNEFILRDPIGMKYLPKKRERVVTSTFFQNYIMTYKNMYSKKKNIRPEVSSFFYLGRNFYGIWMKEKSLLRKCEILKLKSLALRAGVLQNLPQTISKIAPDLRVLDLSVTSFGGDLFKNEGYKSQFNLKRLEVLKLEKFCYHSSIDFQTLESLRELQIFGIEKSILIKSSLPANLFKVKMNQFRWVVENPRISKLLLSRMILFGLETLLIEYIESGACLEEIYLLKNEHDIKCWDSCNIRSGLRVFVLNLDDDDDCQISDIFIEKIKTRECENIRFSDAIWSEKGLIQSNLDYQTHPIFKRIC